LTEFNVPYSYICRKHINPIHPPLLSSFTVSLLLVPSPYHDLFYISVLHYLSVHSSVGFALIFYLQIYCTLISLTPLYQSSVAFSPYPVVFNIFHCILLCLIPTQIKCISILFTLYSSFPTSLTLTFPLLERCSLSLSVSLSLSLSLYVYIYIYIYTYICTHIYIHTHAYICIYDNACIFNCIYFQHIKENI
jgi:hypothetical protein